MEWATGAPLGQFLYVTYNETNFVDMAKQYNYYGGAGYNKKNSTKNAHPESRPWFAVVSKMYQAKTSGELSLIKQMRAHYRSFFGDSRWKFCLQLHVYMYYNISFSGPGTCDILLKLVMAEPKSHSWYGAPESVWINYKSRAKGKGSVN